MLIKVEIDSILIVVIVAVLLKAAIVNNSIVNSFTNVFRIFFMIGYNGYDLSHNNPFGETRFSSLTLKK